MVSSDSWTSTSIPVELAVQLRVMKPAAAIARAGIKGMLAGRSAVIPGIDAKIMTIGMMVVPRGLIRAIHHRSHSKSHDLTKERER